LLLPQHRDTATCSNSTVLAHDLASFIEPSSTARNATDHLQVVLAPNVLEHSAHPALRLLKCLQNANAVACRTAHNQDMHELVTAAQQVERPRIPPLRPLDSIECRTRSMATSQRHVPAQAHRLVMLLDAMKQDTMHDRCRACYAKQAVHGSAHTMAGRVREDGMQCGYCTHEGEEDGERTVDRLQVLLATEAKVRARQRGAQEGCDNRQVIGLACHVAHGFAVIEGDVIAAESQSELDIASPC
jgi:hypothetical protein